MRKNWMWWTAMVVAGLAPLALKSESSLWAQPARPQQVLTAMVTENVNYLPLYVAMSKGYFREEGMEPRIIMMRCDIAVKAMVVGDAHISGCSGSALRAAATGVPVKVIIFFQDKMVLNFISRPQIQSARDIKGKNIGIEAPGSSTDYAVRLALKQMGLDPDRDASYQVLGQTDVRMTALFAGSIDLTVLPPPHDAIARQRGYQQLLFLGDLVPIPFSGMATSDRLIREQPTQVKKILRALLRGLVYGRSNRSEMTEFTARKWGLSQEIAAAAYEVAVTKGGSRDGGAKLEGIQIELDLVRQRLRLKEEVPVAKVVDFSFLNSIQKELGM